GWEIPAGAALLPARVPKRHGAGFEHAGRRWRLSQKTGSNPTEFALFASLVTPLSPCSVHDAAVCSAETRFRHRYHPYNRYWSVIRMFCLEVIASGCGICGSDRFGDSSCLWAADDLQRDLLMI